jgi:hypothetical protein
VVVVGHRDRVVGIGDDVIDVRAAEEADRAGV